MVRIVKEILLDCIKLVKRFLYFLIQCTDVGTEFSNEKEIYQRSHTCP